MLVVTDISAIRRAKQKPRQWGPLSAVRGAVLRNAEALGLSAEAVKSVAPAWEGAGSTLIDPADAGDITIPTGGNEWMNNGLATLAYAANSDAWSATNALQHSTIFGTSLDFPLLLAFSGIAKKAGTTSPDAIATVAIDAYPYVRHRIYIDNSGFAQFQSSRTTSDAPQITYNIDIDDGKEHTLVFLALSDSDRYAYVDGRIVGSDTTYIENLAGYDRVLTYGAANSGGDESGKILLRMGMLAFGDPSVGTAVARRISERPYALLAHPRVPVWFDLGAGGGGGTAYFQSLAGAFPAGSASIARKISVGRAGSFPAGSASIVKKISVGRAGSFPAGSGVASSGGRYSAAVSGSFPAPTGSLTKKIRKGVVGIFGAMAGALRKKTAVTRAGEFPSASGTTSTSYQTSEATSGIFGAMSGAVSTVLNPVVAIRAAIGLIGSRFRRIIGG